MSAVSALSRLQSAIEREGKGHSTSRAEGLALLAAADLNSLFRAAASIRDRSKGRTVSYSRKVFIPLTHLCRDYCGYCTFRSDPTPGFQPYMMPEEVLTSAEAGRRA